MYGSIAPEEKVAQSIGTTSIAVSPSSLASDVHGDQLESMGSDCKSTANHKGERLD